MTQVVISTRKGTYTYDDHQDAYEWMDHLARLGTHYTVSYTNQGVGPT